MAKNPQVRAFTFSVYISDGWNKFDFMLVLLSVVDVLLDVFLSSDVIPIPPGTARRPLTPSADHPLPDPPDLQDSSHD